MVYKMYIVGYQLSKEI